MKERKEVINMHLANVLSILFFLLTGATLYGIYCLLWGFDPNVFSEVTNEEGVGKTFGFLLLLIVGTLLHEAVHGLTWCYFSPKGYKSIRFGIMWNYLAPYCHCTEPLSVRGYAIGALMPLMLVGIVPALFSLALHSLYALSISAIFIGGAIGDLLIVWRLRKESPHAKVLDHPTEAGYIVYEDD